MFNIILLVISILGIIGGIILYYSLLKKDKMKDIMSFQQAMELTNLPIITFHCGQRKLNFIIDTGSVYSVIDNEMINEIPTEETNKTFKMVTATGKDNNDNNIIKIKLEINDTEFTDEFVASSSIHETFEYFKSLHGVRIHGLLGSTFFNKYKYVINFDKYIFYRK